MNIFPQSGEFRTHLLAVPWYAIPAQNVGPGQNPHPFFLKQLGAVNDGVGCIVTDLCDSFVGFLSLAQMKSQLAHNLPGVSVDPIEALRVVQRAVNAGTAQIAFASTLPVRPESSSSFSVSRGKVMFQSTLDIGLEGSRSMPLSIRLEVNIFEVSTIDAGEGIPAPHGCISSRAHNVSANFIREVLILPLTQTLMNVTLLAGSYRSELAKVGHPVASHSELETIKLIGGIQFGQQLSVADVAVTQDPVARSCAEAAAALLSAHVVAAAKKVVADAPRPGAAPTPPAATASAPPPKATAAPTATVESRGERRVGAKAARSDDVTDESPPKRKSSMMETAEERQARLKLQEQIAAQAKKTAAPPAPAPSHTAGAAPATGAPTGKDQSKEDKLKKIRKVLL